MCNNHQDDAGQAAADPELALIGAVHRKGDLYTISEDNLAGYFIPKNLPSKAKHYRQPTGSRVEYT